MNSSALIIFEPLTEYKIIHLTQPAKCEILVASPEIDKVLAEFEFLGIKPASIQDISALDS